MCCFFLICLCEGIPVLSVGVEIVITSNERFFLVDSDNFDHFCPLISYVAFLIAFDDG